MIALTLSAGIIVARALGPELKGQAALLMLIAQSLSMVFSLGLGSAFSFYTAKSTFAPREILSAAIGMGAVLGGIGLGLFFLTWPLHGDVWQGIPRSLILAAAILTPGYIVANFLFRILVGDGKIYEVNLVSFSRSTANFALIVTLVWTIPLGLAGFMGAQYFALMAQFVLLCWFLRKDLAPTRFWSNALLADSLRYGLKSHALLLINFLNYRVDLILIAFFTDMKTVGFYSLAVGMAELMWLVPESTIAPLFSKVAKSATVSRSDITLRTVRWSLLFLAFLALGGICFGKLFILLLYGSEYLPVYQPFLFMLPGVCLFPVFKLITIDLAARGKPGIGAIASATALATNLVANVLLIPRLGAAGAAVATSLSYTCMSVISLFFFLRTTPHSLWELLHFDSEEIAIVKQAYSSCYNRILARY